MAKKLDLGSKKTYDFSTEKSSQTIEISDRSVIRIPTDLIEIGKNIRNLCDDEEDDLRDLGETIKEYGQLEPCIVFKEGEKYVLKVGSRRFKACLLCGIPFVECIVSDSFENEKLRIITQAIENEHRREMSSREREQYIADLKEMGLSNEEIAKVLHKGKSWISTVTRAYTFVQKNADIFKKLDDEPSTRTAWEASQISKDALDNALEVVKEKGMTKKAFQDEIKKAYKQKTGDNEKLENEESLDISFSIDDNIQEEAEINNYNINFSITENNDLKTVRLHFFTFEEMELNNFLTTQINQYYNNKGFKVDSM